MTKLLINKIKDDLKAEQSDASKQGIQVKKQFNILDQQLGPNLESMSNFFGNIDGIDKFNLDYFNPFKKEGFIGREGHGATDKHNIMKSIDGRITIEKPEPGADGGPADDSEYKLYKQYDFQKTHSKSQYSWFILWGFILLILLAIKMYYFVSTFLFGKTNDSSSGASAESSPESSPEPSPEPSPATSPKSDAPKTDAPKTDAPKTDAPKTEEPKSDES